MEATHQICEIANINAPKIEVITKGLQDYTSLAKYGDKLLTSLTRITSAAEIFEVNPTNGDSEQLTFVNSDLYASLEMPTVEKRWVETTDGKKMLVWVVLPPNFDESKKYPTLLYCQGTSKCS